MSHSVGVHHIPVLRTANCRKATEEIDREVFTETKERNFSPDLQMTDSVIIYVKI